jgi:RNA polymerase sigma-70 factor (ECF subfamily)
MDQEKNEQFVRLLSRYQQRIFLFIFSLLPHRTNAEEVLQETCLTLWQKFDSFELGSNFKAWAFQIAYYKTLEFVKRQDRDHLCFGEKFVQSVAALEETSHDTRRMQQMALTTCLEKLPEKDSDIIRRRYRPGGSVKEVANEVGRSTHAVYKALARVRRMLYDCVRSTLGTEDPV